MTLATRRKAALEGLEMILQRQGDRRSTAIERHLFVMICELRCALNEGSVLNLNPLNSVYGDSLTFSVKNVLESAHCAKHDKLPIISLFGDAHRTKVLKCSFG